MIHAMSFSTSALIYSKIRINSIAFYAYIPFHYEIFFDTYQVLYENGSRFHILLHPSELCHVFDGLDWKSRSIYRDMNFIDTERLFKKPSTML